MISARSFAVVLSLSAHASFIALAVARPRHAAPPQAPSSEAIEVSLYSALAPDAERSAPLERVGAAFLSHAAPAAIKQSASRAVGPRSLAESAPATGVEADPGALAPAAFHFALGTVPAQLVTASSNVGSVPLPLGAAPGGAGAAQAPVAESEVSTRAALLAGMPPSYTAAAAAAGIEAELPFEIVVDRAGFVQSARPLAHVGYGLDEAAALAIAQYRFSPAQKAQQRIAVRMRWVVRFQLR